MSTLVDYLGAEDRQLEHVLTMHAVATHWSGLPAREQQILVMEFRGRMPQTEIGRQLQISRMHVSRLRAHALGYLRSYLLDLDGAQAEVGQDTGIRVIRARRP